MCTLVGRVWIKLLGATSKSGVNDRQGAQRYTNLPQIGATAEPSGVMAERGCKANLRSEELK